MFKLLYYAGIGPRSTPPEVCQIMTNIAANLSQSGWTLRSGHAKGADQAFEAGAKSKEIFLPWLGYNRSPSYATIREVDQKQWDIAKEHHPAWNRCSETAKRLLCRNVPILLGHSLSRPADCVITWLPEDNYRGGTRHALNIASTWGIPVFDIRKDEDQEQLVSFIERKEQSLKAASSEVA